MKGALQAKGSMVIQPTRVTAMPKECTSVGSQNPKP